MAKFKTFLMQIIAFVSCLFLGAVVFPVLEQRNDRSVYRRPNSTKILSSFVQQISNKYNISTEELNKTVQQVRTTLKKGDGGKWEEWSFTGSYFFVGTVAFTIGFGHQTPKTALGQIMVIIYALIAIPVAALLLSTCGQHMAEHQQNMVIFIETKVFRKTLPTHLKSKTVSVNMLVLALFLLMSSLLTTYYYDDGWTILEGIYFLWICLTTVGFGDYVVNNGKPIYDGQPLKTIMLRFNIILLIIGLCQVSCILVSIQDTIEENVLKQQPNNQESSNNEETDVNKTDNDPGKDNEAYETGNTEDTL